METNLLDRMLNAYIEQQTPVTITLQNKNRVTGRIKSFDSYVIIMDGQKREIVYRHAMSSVSEAVPHEESRKPSPARSRPQKPSMQKSKPHPAQAMSAPAAETSINNGMKEGLLRWMQEQKAAK